MQGSMTGRRIVVARPSVSVRPRGWAERLLSWPWRPWRRFAVSTVEYVERGQVVILGNYVFCHGADVARLREAGGRLVHEDDVTPPSAGTARPSRSGAGPSSS